MAREQSMKKRNKKKTCESYISRFVPKDSGWWEGGNQIETGKKTTNKSPNKAK